MIEKFPNLKNSQVALIRVEAKTGHVLDENFVLAIHENQKVFSVFENIDDAIAFAKSVTNHRKDIECTIFGEEQKYLQTIREI